MSESSASFYLGIHSHIKEELAKLIPHLW